jgi:hypothetical protein
LKKYGGGQEKYANNIVHRVGNYREANFDLLLEYAQTLKILTNISSG